MSVSAGRAWRSLSNRSARPDVDAAHFGWYNAAPVWAQEILLSGYGAWLRHLRYGGAHRRFSEELRLSQWWTGPELRAWQLRELRRVVGEARVAVPWYRDQRIETPRTLEEFVHLPILTKEEARQAGARMISSAAASRGRLTIHTGGTTGTPLVIHCDRAALRRNYAFFVRALSWAGVGPHPRVATFAGRPVVPAAQRDPPFWRRNHAGNALLCSSYHLSPETVPVYVDAIDRFQPELIDSYPSSLAPVARYIVESGITSIRPAAVVTSSETLTPETRTLLERAFGCRVFDQYGAAEMGGFVSQCEAGTYHCHSEYGIVEILRDGRAAAPGETGELVVTGFVNQVMPFIRYATGDLATRGDDRCPCGRSFPALAAILGRQDDVVVTPDGREIGRLDPVFKGSAGLMEARIVQDRPDHLRVEAVVSEGWSEVEESKVLTELARRVGLGMKVDLVTLERIERGPGGKLRGVVNEVRGRTRDDAADTRSGAGRI